MRVASKKEIRPYEQPISLRSIELQSKWHPGVERSFRTLKILKSRMIEAATVQVEDWEDRQPENRYAVLWKAKNEENRYSARSLKDAEEYYEYRCLLMEQGKI
jgi:hypothetical protein